MNKQLLTVMITAFICLCFGMYFGSMGKEASHHIINTWEDSIGLHVKYWQPDTIIQMTDSESLDAIDRGEVTLQLVKDTNEQISR